MPIELNEMVNERDVVFPIGRMHRCDLFTRTRRQTAHPVQRFLNGKIRHAIEAPILRLSLHKTLFAFVRNQVCDLLADLPPGVFPAG